jgi:hypothetical protein
MFRCGVVGERWGGWVVVKSAKGLVVVASKRVVPIWKARPTRDACPTIWASTVHKRSGCAAVVHRCWSCPPIPGNSWDWVLIPCF